MRQLHVTCKGTGRRIAIDANKVKWIEWKSWEGGSLVVTRPTDEHIAVVECFENLCGQIEDIFPRHTTKVHMEVYPNE